MANANGNVKTALRYLDAHRAEFLDQLIDACVIQPNAFDQLNHFNIELFQPTFRRAAKFRTILCRLMPFDQQTLGLAIGRCDLVEDLNNLRL